MDLATLSLFLPACYALNMAPGPNNLLSVTGTTVGFFALARQEFLLSAAASLLLMAKRA